MDENFQKEREENYQKNIEREKMEKEIERERIEKENYQKESERERTEKEKLQREIEAMKNKLPLEVSLKKRKSFLTKFFSLNRRL